MRLSKTTLALGIFIVISVTFTSQLFYFFYNTFGRDKTQIGLGIIFILFALCGAIHFNKIIVSKKRKFLFLAVFCLGIYFGWQQKILAERVHILEYGLLGWFISRDITRDKTSILKIAYGILIIFLFGCLDEGLQRILPYRYGEFRDLLLNWIGGLWGMSLFLMSPDVSSGRINPHTN